MSGTRNSLLWKKYFLQGLLSKPLELGLQIKQFLFLKIQEIRYQAPGLPKVSSINEIFFLKTFSKYRASSKGFREKSPI